MMRSFVFIVLSFIFILSPFSYGLYFNQDFYGIHIIIYMLFIVLLMRFLIRQEQDQVRQLAFLIVLPLMFLFSFLYAVNPEGSLQTALRWLSYSAFFMLLYWSVSEEKWAKKYLPVVFVISGVSMGLHMLFNVIGWLEFPSAFILNRFAGVFQYPNTFGMVMAVYFLFSIVMVTKEKLRASEIVIYAAPLSLFLYMFIGSMSRGMFIVTPIMFLLALFFMKPSRQVLLLLVSTVAGGAALLLIFIAFSSFIQVLLLIGLSILPVFIVYAWQKHDVGRIFERLDGVHKFKMVIPGVVLLVAMLLFSDLLFEGAVYKQLPTGIQEQVTKLNDSSTFRERVLFTEDALKLSKDAPLLGSGGESWSVLYKNYQQLPYQSKQIHNGFLEILVDLGWIGFIVYGGTFLLLSYFVWINYWKSTDRTQHLAVLLSVVAIFFHSLIDFDFSFGTVWFIVFWLFALSLATEKEWEFLNKRVKSKGMKNRNKKIDELITPSGKVAMYSLYVYGILLIIGLVISFQLMKGEQAYSSTKGTKSFIEAEVFLSEAVNKNKWNRFYLYELGEARFELGDVQSVIKISKQLASLEPDHSLTLEMAGRLAERADEKDRALAYYLTALELDTYNSDLYKQTFTLLLQQDSVKSAEKVITIFKKLEKEYEKFSDNPVGQFHNSRNFTLSDELLSQVVDAYLLLGETDEADALLEKY